ncbi:MAG: PIN domain-containing protein [Deltaproteobacteria bacterium]|nr:PIN domain-containing protein [Deltaproteobacteria bacterium]
MIYLDTNVVLWLAGSHGQLSDHVRETINNAQHLLLSPMVELEIEYLYEVGRIQAGAPHVLSHLRSALDLRLCDHAFSAVVAAAREIKWTRDPFDRLITAQASVGEDTLLTRDKIIRANYAHAEW